MKTTILGKRFLPAYSTAFRVPDTRGGKIFFFQTLLDGPTQQYVWILKSKTIQFSIKIEFSLRRC